MKVRHSKKELTRLVLCALLFGGAGFYGPVAEAAAVSGTIEGQGPSNALPDGFKVKSNKLYGEDGVQNTYTLTFGYTLSNDDWKDYSIYAAWAESGTLSGHRLNVTQTSYGNYYGVSGVYGAYTGNGKAYSNHVYMGGGKVGDVFGGTSGSGSVSEKNVYDNSVNITGGEVSSDVYGGQAAKGSAENNTVTISPATGKTVTIGGIVYGGKAGNTVYGYNGSAKNNTVTVDNNTTIEGATTENSNSRKIAIVGGRAHDEYSSNPTTVASLNTVTVNGGDIKGDIYGGWGNNTNSNSNNVIISNGAVSGSIIGGRGAVTENYNNVTITNGTFSFGNNDKNAITGAVGEEMSYNSVSIGGGTFNISNSEKYYYIGGVFLPSNMGVGSSSLIAHNSLNLYGSTTGLQNAIISGGKAESTASNFSSADNNIYIGGKRTYANNAATPTFTETAAWTGSSGNTVKAIHSVNKIVFRKVNWGSTALNVTNNIDWAANSQTNGLDISGINIVGATSGTMTLLSVGNGTFSGVPIYYKSLTGTGTDWENGLKVTSGNLSTNAITVKNATSNTKYIGTNGESATDTTGVSLTNTTGAHTVKLDSTGKQVQYSIGADGRKVTLGNMSWGTTANGTGLTFGSGTTIDASNLAFTGVGSANNPKDFGTTNPLGQSMTLLSGAVNLAGTITQPGTGKGTVNASFTSNGIALAGTAKGSVSLSGSNLLYTLNSGTLNTINLADWDGTTTSLTGWTKNESGTAVSGSFTAPTLAEGVSSKDILSAWTDLFSNASIDESIAYKANGTFSNGDKGVTLSGNKAGGVKSSDSGKKLTYYAEKYDVDSISLGSMTWGTGRSAAGSYDFTGVSSIDASNLTFTGTADGPDASMTLLSGATGLPGTASITQPTSASVTVAYTDTTSGIKYSGLSNAGNVSIDAEAVKYTISGGTLTGMDMAGWNGTTNPDLPTGWTAPTSGGISVDTGNFDTPTSVSGGQMDIFTTDTEGFFGEVTGTKAYKENAPVDDDEKGGITLIGTKSGGIKPSTDGKKLTYYAEEMQPTGIKPGTVDWNPAGTARTMPASGYDFTGVQNIDVTSLNFNMTEEQQGTVKAGDKMTLVSGATGLSAGKEASHTQEVGHGETNGAVLKGSLNGTVSTTAGTLNYEVTSKTLDNVNLANWDGAATAINASWEQNPNGVTVETNGLAVPTGVPVGTSVEVLTSDNPVFANANVTGDRRYKEQAFANDQSAGVILSGVKSGGIKENADGKKLLYYAETMDTQKISLENLDWGTERAAGAGYNFAHVNTIDATNLDFSVSNDKAGSLAAGNTITLLSNATNLAAGTAVTNATRTQDVGYSTGSGVSLTGNLSGTVSTAAGAVNYTVDSMNLSHVNLDGWNGTASAVPAGWTKSDTISVTGDSFTAPQLGLGSSQNILTTNTDGYFTGATIAPEIAHQERAYSESASSIKLSGKLAQGVSVSDNGQNLVYRVEDAKIDTIALGAVTYQNGATLLDKSDANYDYSRVTALDTTDFDLTMTTEQKKAVQTGDKMTLVKGNSSLKDIAAQSTETSDYSYTANPGLTVNATITGSLSAAGGNVVYTVAENNASQLNFGSVAWNDTYNRPDSEAVYTTALVDASKIVFTGVENLTSGTKMLLVDNFGTSIKKVDSAIFTLDGKTGKGHAYWENGQLWYVIDRGSNETVEAKDAIDGSDTVVTQETREGSVIGGQAQGEGIARENHSAVNGGSIKVKADGTGGDVIGGYSDEGISEKNSASVTGSKVEGNVYGGRSDNGSVSANTASLTNSSIDGNVYGGKSETEAVYENTVSVAGGNVDGNVYGGKTEGAEPADTNMVNLTEGAVVAGGVYGGYSENGTASDNVVTITKATINDYLYGGKSKNQSSNDKVYFNDGTVQGIIGGGCEVSTNNTVTLTEGMVAEHVMGGFADKMATGNTVTMTGGTVTGSVIGGYGAETADSNTIYLGGGTVQGQTITSEALGGVTIAGGVYGGYSSGTGTTANNSIYLYSTADVSATNLYGGNNEATGNNLYVGMLLSDATQSAWTGGSQSVSNITNFETINFTVVPWSKSQAALTITDGTNSDLSMTNVKATQVAFTGVNTLNKDDSMTLLDQSKVAADKQATKITENSSFTVGSSVEGTGKLTRDDKGNVIYTVENIKGSEQTHNTLMGAEAGMAALFAGNVFIGAATEGLSLAENTGADGVACYANIGGGHMKQKTGSHVNVNTWNAIVALGHKNEQKKSTTEYGAFFEYGKGNYATHNDNGQRGDGSATYTGGGLLTKWTNDKGVYVEGSLRAGSVKDNARNLLRDDIQAYSYNTRANYWGFHLGAGKKINVANGNVVDVYGKYFFNRKNGVDFNVNGDEYKLDDVLSKVLRVGARYTLKRDKWNFYGDASYEHEFGGKANGMVNHAAIRGADTSGGSFRLELGATLLPTEKSPWSLNLNLTGYAGKKQGMQGGVSVKYLF